jgi:hypothetical protein
MAGAKRALCVGINKFKNFPENNLNGCVNDARDMASILQGFFGFKKADILLLLDSQATKANILKQLKALVDSAVKGQLTHLVFSLSSHGTQVPDRSGDEPDRADEAFCPHDLAAKGDQWDPARIITDDELRALFSRVPRDVVLEVFLDTCHSGTGLKVIDLLPGRRPRYIPPPSPAAFRAVEGLRMRGSAATVVDAGRPENILWAACKPDQTSADASIAGGWHGAFTWFLCKAVRASGNAPAREVVLKRVREGLKAGDYTQSPQLECKAAQRKKPLMS